MSHMSEKDIAKQEILEGLDNLTQSLADFGCNRLAAQAAKMFCEFEEAVNNSDMKRGN